MRRWHPTALLAGLAGAAALLAPPIQARVTGAPPQVPDTLPQPLVEVTPPPISEASSSNLHLTAGLDHPAVLEATTQERLLVVTVKADELEGGERAPLNVAVVMDRSGSMRHQGKIENARAAASELVRALEEEDRFSLVTFSANAHLVVPSSPLSSRADLLQSIAMVHPSGSTNLSAGLDMGQNQVSMYASPESVDRVIIISDGQPTAGTVAPDALARQASSWTENGVSVSTIGLGLEYNEDLLADMADAGGGTYRFVDAATDLEVAFQEELHRLNTVAARGVGLDIDLQDAELIDVLGYDAQVTDTGVRVYLGDVYSGETRRVVLRVRMSGTSDGDRLTAANVRLSEGATQVAGPVSADALVTARPEVIETTVNRDLAILGNEAAAAAYAQEAAVAYASGDRKKAEDLLDSGTLIAGEAASRYGSNELQVQASTYRQQNVDYDAWEPESEEGLRMVKSNKMEYRDELR